LPIWVPCFPPKELEREYDFDIGAIVFSFYNTQVLGDHEKFLDQARKKFLGKSSIGLHLLECRQRAPLADRRGVRAVAQLFRGRPQPAQVVRAAHLPVQNLRDQPEYAQWAKEAIARVKRRHTYNHP